MLDNFVPAFILFVSLILASLFEDFKREQKMLKKMLKSNEKAKANYKQVEATATKIKEEIDKQITDEEGEVIEEEAISGENKFVEMVQHFQECGWIDQNINPDAFSVSIKMDKTSHFNLYEFKILFGIWLKYFVETKQVVASPHLMKEFYRLCPAFGPKHPNYKFLSEMKQDTPFDKTQSVAAMFEESIPVPREAAAIAKNLDWIRAGFTIAFTLKKKYPGYDYEKNFFCFETRMTCAIKRNNFGNRSVYLGYEINEDYDDFCKVSKFKQANEGLKEPTVIAEVLKGMIQAIEQTPQGLQTISNKMTSTFLEIKKGKH